MNLLTILDKLSDDKFFSTETSRLGSLSQISNFGKKAALAGIPLGLGSLMATSAKAETTQSSGSAFAPASALTDALQLALTLEYLEDEYYREGVAKPGLIPSGDRAVFMQISKHETAHVAFLKATLTSLGTTPGSKPNFDFTAGGNFQPFDDYETFMTLAQAFEDTGVRAYKGQAGNVASNKPVLQAALQIHSVEARHASQVRRMRMNKGWIELNNGGNMPAATDAVYAGEENVLQAGFNTSRLFGAAAGSASFDETITGDQAAMIAGLFIS
ncbi:ferritin-like domain-containing protein [Kaistella sp. 97-N-M2]|uniref:ferritin-like domain-containing protein n=1 Tax=Kaistella sp. 97-N-M2 TaxID=2908645 RepID=UPI001F161029|nr:ferritin-like domain-containing protein [Kaistella sp. 97-N-M2]UJF30565.1 ferritin-like domain-containing protein [Kaistella sp. 97-N-M2]